MSTCGMARKAALFITIAAVLMPVSVRSQPKDEIHSHLTLRTFTDFGHIVSGTNDFADTAANLPRHLSMQPLNRASFLAIQEASIGNFDVTAGLAGLIWWPYGGGITDADERVMNLKPMVPVARARWRFGEPTLTSSELSIGTFSHKYNPDAKNLGEYLYRSGTYPGFLFTTEGWLLMNRASNYSHGALFSLSQWGGSLKHNFSLFMETNYYPIGDFSPGYDVSFTNKWFEFGAGAVFNHFLALRPSLLEPKTDENTYVHAHVDTAPGQAIHYYGPRDKVPGYYYVSDDLIYRFKDDPGYTEAPLHNWTHKGIKTMARAALNLGFLLPEAKRNPDDLRLFAEVAVLGWKNQPLYFEKRNERMPIMFGIHVPTFKLLDGLTFQAEYYESGFNNYDRFNSGSLPIWATDFDTTAFVEQAVNPKDPTETFFVFNNLLALDNGKIVPTANRKDDWKWSLNAKKTVNKFFTVHTQAASDHLRLMSGPRQVAASPAPLTASPKEWYYLVRLEFSLR